MNTFQKFLSILLVTGLLLAAQPERPARAASVPVSNNEDDGAGSLRAAIAIANSGDTITFNAGLAGETINLASPLVISKNLTIDGSGLDPYVTVSGNDAVQIFNIDSEVTVKIKNINIANGKASTGGSIDNRGELSIYGVTFSGNNAGYGGGIYNAGVLEVVNSTFSENNATAGYGGGIYNYFGELTTVNTTFSDNSAVYNGGAIYSNNGTLYLQNSLLGNSASNTDCYSNGGAVVTNTNNLIETNAIGVNACGTPAITGDPVLGTLADYGGPVRTFALLPGSPAIDAGDDAVCADAATVNNLDQRGVSRSWSTHCDIGAYESTIVTNTNNSGAGSLRQAIADAVENIPIIFNSNLANGTITLGSSLIIDKNLIIDGSGLSAHIKVSGANGVSPFQVDSGAVATLKDISITGATNSGISNTGDLTVTNMTFYDNSASAGAAINNSGTLTVVNSTFSGNTATGGYGGAAYNTGTLTSTNNTFSANSASSEGGGLYNSGTLHLENTLLANSLSNSDCYNDGALVTDSHNLIETNAAGVNACGAPVVTDDPLLGPLADNGGPALTFALLLGPPDSPAIDAGDNAACAGTDQRGISRPQGDHCDIGSYEDDSIPPEVFSIIAADPNPTSATSVSFTVTFTEPVTGVDESDFTLTLGGISGAVITGLSGSGATYTVQASTGNGIGSIRLDLVDDDSILDYAKNRLGGLGLGNGSFDMGEAYTVYRAATFADVPTSHWAWEYIEVLYANDLTAGCDVNPLRYCPDTILDRAQSAVFMLRGNFGSTYSPPPPPWNLFADNWSLGAWAEKWAEGMYNAQLTAGCSVKPLKFCPWDKLPRTQVAVFGLKLKYGDSYSPPDATGTVFADITNPGVWYAKWAEQAYADGLLLECGTQGGKPLFCPDQLVNRAWGAYVVVKAKGLLP